ncbi:Dph6-related ATP pyrophosphatase [Geofilum rhodophaeum]|uniref:Dph6-related ATP pyrophosphatase n=1 Tax=Geofilum rhodophaeum TaxID=1965019 RepID=UPI000B521BCD|nr:diphthine--ammonia ligase [Geofilum rhodophaeum]
MKAFASWSGGKDCMLAVYRYLQTNDHEMACLVNMCDADGEQSRSHGIHKRFIQSQARAMNLPIVQQAVDARGYESCFKAVVNELKKEGVTVGVFGDIYLVEHRQWIERVCEDLDVAPIFPLWENDTQALLMEFVELGFKALTVAVHKNKLGEHWVGRELDLPFFKEITAIADIDPCAENGEYHSFVYDGPLFSHPVAFEKGTPYEKDYHVFLPLK